MGTPDPSSVYQTRSPRGPRPSSSQGKRQRVHYVLDPKRRGDKVGERRRDEGEGYLPGPEYGDGTYGWTTHFPESEWSLVESPMVWR